jgi:hypothetical protein
MWSSASITDLYTDRTAKKRAKADIGLQTLQNEHPRTLRLHGRETHAFFLRLRELGEGFRGRTRELVKAVHANNRDLFLEAAGDKREFEFPMMKYRSGDGYTAYATVVKFNANATKYTLKVPEVAGPGMGVAGVSPYVNVGPPFTVNWGAREQQAGDVCGPHFVLPGMETPENKERWIGSVNGSWATTIYVKALTLAAHVPGEWDPIFTQEVKTKSGLWALMDVLQAVVDTDFDREKFRKAFWEGYNTRTQLDWRRVDVERAFKETLLRYHRVMSCMVPPQTAPRAVEIREKFNRAALGHYDALSMACLGGILDPRTGTVCDTARDGAAAIRAQDLENTLDDPATAPAAAAAAEAELVALRTANPWLTLYAE